MEDEFDQSEPVREASIDFSEACQVVSLDNGGYLALNTEFDARLNQTGRIHVFTTNPDHGSSTFWVEIDDNGIWQAETMPPWVKLDDVVRIIERDA